MAITSVNELWGKRWQLKKEPTFPVESVELYVVNYSSGVYPATWIYDIDDYRKVMANASSGKFMDISSDFISLGVSMDIWSSYDGWNQTYSSDNPRVLDFIEKPSDNSFVENADFVTWWNANATEYTVAAEFKSLFDDIAAAIREKDGTTDTMTPRYFPTRIRAIEGGGGITPEGTLNITVNGDYNVTNYAMAAVRVPNVIPDGYIKPAGTLEITANGSYDAAEYASVNVAVEGGGSSGPSFADYAAMRSKNTRYMFTESTAENLDEFINALDTSNVTNMSSMFEGCSKLVSIPYFDTNNVTNSTYMFSGCNKLQSIPYMKFTGSMSNMFNYCNALTKIKLNLGTYGPTNMNYTFDSCPRTVTIDITSMDNCTSSYNTSYMCRGCSTLKNFVIRSMTRVPSLNTNSFQNCYHFTGTVNSTYNPDGLKDGRIYVPDEMVDTLKAATNWSTYADIIVPLSEYVEE